MRQSHLILTNTIAMWASQALQLVPQLVMVPYLITTIGDAGYGVYALVWSLMVSIEQLQMSLQQGVVKYSASYLARGQMDEVNRVVSSSFIYAILLAVLAGIVTLIAAVFYRDSSGQIGSALSVVGIMVLFIVPLTPYVAVIQSRQLYYIGAMAGTLAKYVGLLAVIAWFSMVKPSVNALIIIMAVVLFLSRLAQVPFAYRLVPGLKNRPSLCNWMHFKLIVFFGGMIVLIGLFLMANSTGIRWIMGTLASTSFVAHLAIMLMPSDLLSQAVMAMTVTVMPATSAYEASGNREMLQELLIRGMRYTMILTLAGLLVAGLLLRDVLTVWVGSNYVFLEGYALALLSSVALMLSTSTAHHMLKGLGKLRVTVFISLMGLVVVPIVIIFTAFQTWSNPYLAATVGLVSGNIVYGILQVAVAARVVQINLRRIATRVYAQPLMIAAIVWLVIFAILASGDLNGLIARSCLSLLSVLMFCCGCYAFIATSSERQQIRAIVQMAADKCAAIRAILPNMPQ